MAKTSKKHQEVQSDEEYKFNEEEEQPFIEEPVEKPKKNYLTLFKNKKLIAIIGVFLAIFAVYQYLGYTTKSKRDVTVVTANQPVPSLTQHTGITTGAPAPQAATIATPLSLPAEPAGAINNQEQQIAAMNQTIQQNQMQIQQLQNNIQQLQNSIGQLNSQLANINAGMATRQQVAVQQPTPAKAATKPAVAKSQPRPPVYTIRAIIPGRAWLQAKQKNQVVKLVTVKVGDYLPGYGRVQAMNASQGKIWTSSGKVILLNDNGEPTIRI